MNISVTKIRQRVINLIVKTSVLQRNEIPEAETNFAYNVTFNVKSKDGTVD